MSQPSQSPSAAPAVSLPTAPARDLTDPAQGPHAVQKVIDAALHALAGVGCEVVLHRASPVSPLADAAPRLAAAPRAGLLVARPTAVRREGGETGHRLDLWWIRREPRLGLPELAGMIGVVTRAVAAGFPLSTVPASDPHRVEGRRIDLRARGAWLEIGHGGIVPPALLGDLGLPEETSALALSLELDALVMLAKGLDDPALLTSDDPRVAAQMRDLSPYVPVELVAEAGEAAAGPATLAVVRASIDEVDARIVKLLSERRAYALLAGRLKRGDDVRMPAREEEVVSKVRTLAREAGIEPDLVEGLYRHLMDEFVRLQREARRAGSTVAA